jgi:hypothetical protein
MSQASVSWREMDVEREPGAAADIVDRRVPLQSG